MNPTNIKLIERTNMANRNEIKDQNGTKNS